MNILYLTIIFFFTLILCCNYNFHGGQTCPSDIDMIKELKKIRKYKLINNLKQVLLHYIILNNLDNILDNTKIYIDYNKLDMAFIETLNNNIVQINNFDDIFNNSEKKIISLIGGSNINVQQLRQKLCSNYLLVKKNFNLITNKYKKIFKTNLDNAKSEIISDIDSIKAISNPTPILLKYNILKFIIPNSSLDNNSAPTKLNILNNPYINYINIVNDQINANYKENIFDCSTYSLTTNSKLNLLYINYFINKNNINNDLLYQKNYINTIGINCNIYDLKFETTSKIKNYLNDIYSEIDDKITITFNFKKDITINIVQLKIDNNIISSGSYNWSISDSDDTNKKFKLVYTVSKLDKLGYISLIINDMNINTNIFLNTFELYTDKYLRIHKIYNFEHLIKSMVFHVCSLWVEYRHEINSRTGFFSAWYSNYTWIRPKIIYNQVYNYNYMRDYITNTGEYMSEDYKTKLKSRLSEKYYSFIDKITSLVQKLGPYDSTTSSVEERKVHKQKFKNILCTIMKDETFWKIEINYKLCIHHLHFMIPSTFKKKKEIINSFKQSFDKNELYSRINLYDYKFIVFEYRICYLIFKLEKITNNKYKIKNIYIDISMLYSNFGNYHAEEMDFIGHNSVRGFYKYDNNPCPYYNSIAGRSWKGYAETLLRKFPVYRDTYLRKYYPGPLRNLHLGPPVYNTIEHLNFIEMTNQEKNSIRDYINLHIEYFYKDGTEVYIKIHDKNIYLSNEIVTYIGKGDIPVFKNKNNSDNFVWIMKVLKHDRGGRTARDPYFFKLLNKKTREFAVFKYEDRSKLDTFIPYKNHSDYYTKNKDILESSNDGIILDILGPGIEYFYDNWTWKARKLEIIEKV